MKKLILLFSIVFMIFLVGATSNLGTFKQGDCIELYQLCDNCTYVNLTSITFPDSTLTTIGSSMTKSDVDYNHTFCNTTVLGDHSYKVCGDKDGVFSCEVIDFLITPSGRSDNSSYFIVIILIIYAVAFIGFFGKNEWVTMIGGLAMMILGLYIVRNGIIIYRDFLTNAISYFTIGLGAFFSLYTGYELIRENY